MRALTFTSVLLGAKELRRWFASLSPGARAGAYVRKFPSVRAMRAPMFASCVPGAQCVRPRSQVVIRFSVSRPSRLSGARGAHRRIAKGLGIAMRGM